MITTERLEELIKQGATIWSDASWYKGKIHLINNDTDEYQVIMPNHIDDEYVYLNHHKKGTEHIYDGDWCLEDLREDADRAEWEYKMTAERTDRFDPPMWEDMQKILQQEPYYNFVFVKNNRVYEFVVSDKLGVRNYDCIDLDKYLFFGNSTKENYTKACEIVRDLFNKGGAK